MERADAAAGYLRALDLDRGAVDLDFLSELTARHVDRIPFSSVGPMLGDPLPLDLPSLFDRLVTRRRGGYCFEQNRFMYEMLQEFGFTVHRYLARVVIDGSGDPPLTHRLTVVDLDGAEFIVDVGFGGIGPVRPLALPSPDAPLSWRSFRVVARSPARFQVEAERKGAFHPLYVFDRAEYGEADCELGHFYSHRHPDAIFVNHLVVMRTTVGEVRSLNDGVRHLLRPDGDEREQVVSAPRLHEILNDELGLRVSAEESARLFDRISGAR